MKNTFCLFLIFTSSLLYSQENNFSNYEPLKSQGQIPDVFIKLSIDRYTQEVKKMGNNYDKAELKKREDFFLKSSYHTSEILHSGKVLFGDPITLYVRDVAKELLKNNLSVFNKLSFYTLKSTVPNASSTAHGIIFVNTGLIAKLESEAELAFVLAHEIAHYIEDDPLNSYLNNVEILKGKGRFNSKSWYDKINKLGKYSREIEFKADSIGTALFLESKYAPDCISGALESLYYSHLPIRETAFNKKFFNNKPLIIPECYFADKIPPISEIIEYDDEEHTHPNVFKRIKEVNAQIPENKSSVNKIFIVSEERFKYIQKIAQFEQVRLNILVKDYGNAIYNSFYLLYVHPNNEYLETNIAKALYGLARYKNAGEYHKVAKSYTKIEGESHQVHFFLRQLTKKQLNAIAIHYLWNLIQKYGTNNCLNQLETGLINDLVIYNDINIDSFGKSKQEIKRVADDRNSNPSKRELQRKFKDFYKPVFVVVFACI